MGIRPISAPVAIPVIEIKLNPTDQAITNNELVMVGLAMAITDKVRRDKEQRKPNS
jgi:hypothetical protein